MAALRAMLQLRPGTSTPLSSSPTTYSQLQDSSFSSNINNNASTQSLETTSILSSFTLTPSVQSTSLQSTISNTSSRITSSIPNNKKSNINLGLHSGAASGNLGLVKFALDNGQPIDSVVNGVLPIHAACCNNANVPVVLFLIDHGADVNARRQPRKYGSDRTAGSQAVGTTGSTPLHFAAANGCLAIVEMLLKHGATPDLVDKYGTTPYAVATARNHPEVADLLHLHTSMQRGPQVIAPVTEVRSNKEKDLFTSPRNSGEFSRRMSAILTPNKSITSQSEASLPLPAPIPSPTHINTSNLSAAAIRNLNQRRVSLPSIMESPSSPNAPLDPRQSCDLGRPLPSRNSLQGKPETFKDSLNGHITNTPTSSQPQKEESNSKGTIRSSQNSLPNLLNVLDPISVGRRKSVDISAMGFLTPPVSHQIHRQASLDQILAARPADGKIRRDSDASTSETVVSEPSSCSTRASPLIHCNNENQFFMEEAEKLRILSPIESSPMGRSVSQPPHLFNESSTDEVPEPSIRKSFDLRLFASSRQPVSASAKDEEKSNWRGYRRRSIQEPFLMTAFTEDSSNRDPATTSDGLPKENARTNSKHRASFSGSATISGRISRLWANGPGREGQDVVFHKKDNSVGSIGSFGGDTSEGGIWNDGELTRSSHEAIGLGISHRDIGGDKGRAGVMSRFSGIWTRR
ncbi:hypothetical protein BGZ76_011379 [Entomortierella beljakovae]|nr:hypothetical protein BGZ76_011379 [Entomortierella beljakovae]